MKKDLSAKPVDRLAKPSEKSASKPKAAAGEKPEMKKDVGEDEQENPFGILSAKKSDEEKLPVPSEEDQAQAEKLIKDLFKADYLKAKPAPRKLALAKQLLASVPSSDADPSGAYVTLREARDLAVAAGDVDTVLQAIDQLTDRYRLKPLAMKLEHLEALNKGTTIPAMLAALAEETLDLIGQAVADDDYETAQKFQTLAQSAARKSRNNDLLKRATVRGEELDELVRRFAQVRAAFETLKTKPDDPAANLIAGRYMCLQKGSWDRGLPKLARGDDELLKGLAQRELAKPAGKADYVALGDAWWDVAEQQSGPARTNARVRAAEWYLVVVQDVSGPTRTRIEKRLEAINSGTADADMAGAAFLSDLEALDIKVEKNWFNQHGHTPFGEKLKVNGKETPHGIFMHPRSNGFASVSFDLGKQRYKMFEAGVGLPEGDNPPVTPLTFELWGSGKQPLWKSAAVAKPGRVIPCKVKLPNLSRIELRVNCPGDSKHAYGVWCEPRLRK